MANLNLNYYKDEDRYSDGDIEETMLKMVNEGISYDSLSDDQVSFPMIYHFSKIRHNILNWYPFKKDAAVLEIGAGCGALTGLLCQKAKEVVAVELSKRRATINLNRHQSFDNLTIMVGNLNDMKFQKKFDYIVLNGVLEYAASFTENDRPYVTFLKNMSAFLKSDGRLLIAIENRLGLKYFAGAPEDHTDVYYLGLNNYKQNKSVSTFSKQELIGLLYESGLPFFKFYYPYPDYKFPTEIFTDESLEANGYGRPYKTFSTNRFHLFEESEVAHTLASEGVVDCFANSFLVDAGVQELKDSPEISYVKINSERKEIFQTYTIILGKNGKKYVEKKAVSPHAVPFVNTILNNSNLNLPAPYINLPSEGHNGALSYPFIEGQTMFEVIRDYVKKKDKKQIVSLLQNFYDTYFIEKTEQYGIYEKPFKEVFGDFKGKPFYECIYPANIDLICENIFIGEDKTYIIDYEWVFDFPVPALFVMWRMINELYTKLPELDQVINRGELQNLFHIDVVDQEAFLEWSKHFAYVYVGSEAINRYAKSELYTDLNQIADEKLSEHRLPARLYYDIGNGLNEKECITKSFDLRNNRFKITFDLGKIRGIRYIRIDIRQQPCWCVIERIESECQTGLIPVGDYLYQNGKTVFLTENPSYIIDTFTPDRIGCLEIEGRIQPLTNELLLKSVRKIKALSEQEKDSTVIEKAAAEEIPVEESAQQDTIKSLIKQIAKRIIKRNYGVKSGHNKVQKYSSRPLGNVDVFNYENGILYAAGWVYDPACVNNSGSIVYYYGDKIIATHPYTVIYRGDVAEALRCEKAEQGGFTMTSQIVTPCELMVVLEYNTQSGKGGMPLGRIPADTGELTNHEPIVMPFMEKTQIGDIRYFSDNYLTEKRSIPPEIFGCEIDIIIPVYNGIEYFDALFEGIRLTHMPYRLFIVNDKSPDERVFPYLSAYAERYPNVVLINNEENLGFVGSVNKALKQTRNHVVLLNTDVVVSYQWLERLMIPIICMDKVASATPFTTSGTICSFPEFGEDNPIFEGMRLWQVDDVFSKIKPQYPSIPTGVGFCMGMNKEAIREVGFLDEESFGRGFGEENDWCQRAIGLGYKNVHVDNLFVYHKHCGSFLSEEKAKLLEENSKSLLRKHPEYNKDVAAYCQIDPLRPVRLYVTLQLLNQMLNVRSTVAFDHNLGGGATEYLDKKSKELLQKNQKFIIIRYDITQNRFYVIYRYKAYTVEFFTEKLKAVLPLLGRVDEIWINELVTFQNVYDVLDTISQWKEEQGARLKMLMHDYFAICPAINLMDASGKFCDVGDVEMCSECIPNNASNACLDYRTACLWRKNWNEFLQSCDEVTIFSESSADLLAKAYPDLNNINLIPHEPHYLPKLNKNHKTTKTLNIGLLGILCYKKGLDFVKQMLQIIDEKGLNIRIALIGESDEPIKSPSFTMTGRYSREQIPRLTLEQDIDIFMIPSIWPETYSYTTSEIMSMGMPIAVFDIGAPVERVNRYDKGIVLSRSLNATRILEQISSFAESVCKIWEMPLCTDKILFVAEEISFASRYRVEHFREQLLREGIPSDYIQLSDAKRCKAKSYKSVVFYRCRLDQRMGALIRDAKENKVSIYYDIDDLIFNYDNIGYLDFLKDKEYQDFEDTAREIHQAMELCDGFLTSTNTLASEIEKEFSDKPVVIKRNVASMEMETLSMNAWKETVKDAEKVCVGYFSGSGTHNKDFAMIESVLDEIMQEYPQVYLKLGGVIEESRLKKYNDRIIRLDFMEWQKLPEAIAKVDINLMPLEETVFHCCKSENKWMEAALVQVPSIMSRNKELEQIVENYETGVLCTGFKEWKTALRRLIEDQKLRYKIGSAANQKVLDRYTTSGTGTEAIELITR